MKKTIIIALLLLLTSCVSQNNESMQNSHSDPSQENTTNTVTESAGESEGTTLVIDVSSDRGIIFETDIGIRVIAKIVSIDGYDNYWSDENVYGGIYTYGKMEIMKVFNGDVEEGEQVGFVIAGGTLSFDRYAKGQDPTSLEKQIRTIKESGHDLPSYVTRRIEGTQIEEGNIYYLVTGKKRDVHGESYTIFPYEDTFMLADESTINNDEILAYRTDAKVWQDVTKIQFPKDKNDK